MGVDCLQDFSVSPRSLGTFWVFGLAIISDNNSIDDNNFSARQQPFTMSVWSSNIQPNAEGFSMDYTQVKSRIWDNHLIGYKFQLAC